MITVTPEFALCASVTARRDLEIVVEQPTRGCGASRADIVIVGLDFEVPPSFARGMSDIECGRVVDIDTVHSDEPPPNK